MIHSLPTDKTYIAGACIGRFQLNDLHDAHKYVIDQVCSNHKRVVLFLGIAKSIGGRRNALDYETRKYMIQESYPDITILPLPDIREDDDWSEEIDKRLREIYPLGDILLYGGRDSFIPYYKGQFDTKELDQYTFISATEIRKSISETVKKTSDFRSGVIFNAYNQPPVVRSTVDIAVFNEDKSRVLLHRKRGEKKYRFIGGFVQTTDNSNEDAAKRIYMSKTHTEICDIKYVTSMKINDWRYRSEDDKVITNFFTGKYMFGALDPSDGELTWFNTKEVFADINKVIDVEHIGLCTKLFDIVNK